MKRFNLSEWAITHQALVLAPVTVTSFTESDALVTSGINAGDKVVTLGVQKLDAGQKVRALERR